MSIRALNWLPLAQDLQCSEVEQVIWLISVFLDPEDFRCWGPAVVTDKQEGIPSLRD